MNRFLRKSVWRLAADGALFTDVCASRSICLPWPEGACETLFDLKSDLLEHYHCIADPAQADRLAALRSRFEELQREAR